MVNHCSRDVEEEQTTTTMTTTITNPQSHSRDDRGRPRRGEGGEGRRKGGGGGGRKGVGAGEVTEIVRGLYLSGFRAVRQSRLAELGIDLVINATVELPNLPMEGVEVLAVKVSDNGKSDLYSQLDEAVDRIESARQANGRVLVHCVAGASRSPAVVIGYLVKHGDMSLRDAFQHVRRLRPNARPNSGFFSQLIDFERRIRGRTSVNVIRDEGSGLSIPDVCVDELEALRDKRLARCVGERRNFQRVYA